MVKGDSQSGERHVVRLVIIISPYIVRVFCFVMSAMGICEKWIIPIVFISINLCSVSVCGYTNQWAAHIEGGPAIAQQVAEDHGFRYLDKVNEYEYLI